MKLTPAALTYIDPTFWPATMLDHVSLSTYTEPTYDLHDFIIFTLSLSSFGFLPGLFPFEDASANLPVKQYKTNGKRKEKLNKTIQTLWRYPFILKLKHFIENVTENVCSDNITWKAIWKKNPSMTDAKVIVFVQIFIWCNV